VIIAAAAAQHTFIPATIIVKSLSDSHALSDKIITAKTIIDKMNNSSACSDPHTNVAIVNIRAGAIKEILPAAMRDFLKPMDNISKAKEEHNKAR
jgi:hypothetical protein